MTTSSKSLIPLSSLVLLVPHLAAYGLEHFWLKQRRQQQQHGDKKKQEAGEDDGEDHLLFPSDGEDDVLLPSEEEEGEEEGEEGIDEDLSAEERNRNDVSRFFQLPPYVKISLIESEDECERLMAQLLQELQVTSSSDENTQSSPLLKNRQVLGFDIEWKPNSGTQKHLASLIQLSTSSHSYLIRLSKFSCFKRAFSYSSPFEEETTVSSFPPTLRVLLEHPFVLKSGVAVYSDARKLHQDFGIQMRGLIDLQAVVTHRPDLHQLFAQSGTSLSALCGSVLGKPLAKDHWIRCSNWEAPSLSDDQTRYAATDAYVGHAILTTICSKVNFLQGQTQQSEIEGDGDEEGDMDLKKSFTNESEEEKEEDSLEWCYFLVDRRSIIPSAVQTATSKKSSSSVLREISEIRKPHRKTALFYNCRILEPNGELLCCCDMKRLDWYLKRGLAEREPGEIPTIKLKFKPRGKGHAGDAFHLSWKENRCVRCGSYESFSKHSVVPHLYRSHFPEEAKSYNNHDTLLLCTSCAPVAWDGVEKMKQKIAEETGIPLTLGLTRFEVDKNIAKVKGCARSLKKTSWYKGLSQDTASASSSSARRKREPSEECLEDLLSAIRSWTGRDEVTQEDIDKACKIETRRTTLEQETHSKAVVARLKTVEDYQLFVERWRQNFLDFLQPQYMPVHWSVTHPLLNPNGTRTFRLPPVLDVGENYACRDASLPPSLPSAVTLDEITETNNEMDL